MTSSRTLVFAVAVLVGTTMACKLLKRGASDEDASPSASGVAVPVPTPSATPNVSAVAEPQGLFEDYLPKGLVPVDRSPVPVSALASAAKQEDAASKARNAKRYDEAIALYLDALRTDPGFPAARYNLARTLILDGQVEAGLAVLYQLHRVKNCFRCEGLLLRAAQEKDFANARDRLEFKELTEGIGKKLPTIAFAAKQVIAWLDAPRLDNMPGVVDERTFIVLQTPKGYQKIRGAGAFIDYVVTHGKENFPKGRKWGPSVGPPLGMSLECKGTCCNVDSYDPPKGRSVLRELCFKHQGNAAVALYKVKVD